MKKCREKELTEEIELLRQTIRTREDEYKEQAFLVQEEKIKLEQNEKMLHALVEAAAGKIGQDFFDNIVAKLAEWLDADCVLIGRMTEEERIVAEPLYLDGEISRNFSYALKDTPCSVTSRKGFCSYPENVIKLFPKDEILVDLNAEGYIGSALYNKQGQANGVICAVSRKKLRVPPYAQDIMKIIGARVSAELERKKTEEALRRSEAELKQSNETKDKFFSIIAHDLMSPLGTNKSFGEMLLHNFNNYSPEKNMKYLGIIVDNTNHLLILLNNLLDWARSQQGLINRKTENLSLEEVVRTSILPLREMANQKDISIELAIPAKERIMANKDMLSTVVRNLVSNALKYTNRQGRVHICCRLYPTREEYVQLLIMDNGIGISEDVRKSLFEPSHHASSPGTENERGTGLGLLLCKEFVDQMGGNISVESNPGNGSTFIVSLKTA